MGFTTGLLGGLTLATGILYLTAQTHKQNRLRQSLAMQQSSLVLNHMVDPSRPGDGTEPPPQEAPLRDRELVPPGIWQMAKDRWNGEVENLVTKANGTDWKRVRESIEDVGAATWRSIRQAGSDNSGSKGERS